MEKVTDQIRRQLDDMLETMYQKEGCGLAGPQVDIGHRLVVMDIALQEEKPCPIKMVNPEITWTSRDVQIIDDGCLSVPNYFAKTKRPAHIKYQYLDETGALVQKEAKGFEAACVDHEIDHLNGILFIDRLSRLKRDRILKKLRNNRAQNFNAFSLEKKIEPWPRDKRTTLPFNRRGCLIPIHPCFFPRKLPSIGHPLRRLGNRFHCSRLNSFQRLTN